MHADVACMRACVHTCMHIVRWLCMHAPACECCSSKHNMPAPLVLPPLHQVPPFVTFLRPSVDPPPYEPVRSPGALKELLADKLEVYKTEPGMEPLDLVLFE